MGMATYIGAWSHLSKWQRRMKAVGFEMIDGKRPEQMTDAECEDAFRKLATRYGISYIWHDN